MCAAANALGDSTGKEIKVVKKRVLSAAGRAAIIKAAKKRWSKVRKQAKKVRGTEAHWCDEEPVRRGCHAPKACFIVRGNLRQAIRPKVPRSRPA